MFMSFAMAAAALGFFAVMVWTAGEEPLDIDIV
jgi:purine-cytosine permease-like protein